jgi:hypothetical protein
MPVNPSGSLPDAARWLSLQPAIPLSLPDGRPHEPAT